MKSPVRNPWSQMQILKRFMCSTFLFSSLFLHMWSQNVIFDLRQHVVQRILKKWVQVRQKKKFLTYKRIYSRWTVSESCSQEWEKTNCHRSRETPAQKNTQWDTSSHGLASPEPRPQHHWSNVGWSWQRKQRSEKIFECSRSLQNYFWRILREMRRKLKSKDGHNKYSSRFKLVQSQFVL